MKTDKENLREMLRGYDRAEQGGVARGGVHLQDEDFIRLIETKPLAGTSSPTENNGNLPALPDELAPLRAHLANCESCLAQFKDFYAFFAPAEKGEPAAGKSEIDVAWQSFAPRVAQKSETEKKKKLKFLTWLFPVERKVNYAAAFGWGFAALLLIFTGISIFLAWQARNEKSELARELENQKRTFEERLKSLEESEQTSGERANQEKTRLEEEKDLLQKRVATLETEIERAKREPQAFGDVTPPARNPPVAASPSKSEADNSLVAVNTPIYDVFPADSAVRGNSQSENKIVVPNAARSVVLILNAAGRADFPAYQAELANDSGKTIWRGGGLYKAAAGNFTLTLSRRALKAGNYRLRLSGRDKSNSQAIAEYGLTVEIK